MQEDEYVNLGHNLSNGICSHLILLYLQSLADCLMIIFINLVSYLIIQIQHAVKQSKQRKRFYAQYDYIHIKHTLGTFIQDKNKI